MRVDYNTVEYIMVHLSILWYTIAVYNTLKYITVFYDIL